MAFNGRFILNLSLLASRQGADITELIALSGKTHKELMKENCIVEDSNYNRVIEKAIESTEDLHFGLHAGENLNLSAAGLILQLVQTSETIKQAYELCCQYANLGCSALPMELKESSNNYELIFTPNQIWKADSEIAFQHTVLGVLVFKAKEFYSLTHMQNYPVEVNLTWDKSRDFEKIEKSFGCRVNYSKSAISMSFKKEHIESPIITSNYTLLKILVSHAEEISSKKKADSGYYTVVTQTVINLIKPEFPTIEQVASHLNLSKRSLQRRLQEESLSFKKIIEELKREFALGYIKKQDLSVSDIAYLLNYTEVSTFTRSFKRWTGKSPVKFRKELMK
jgi:AraC-like DNA-binding protein